MRRAFARILLAAFGAFVGLALLEVALQLAAPLVRPAPRPLAAQGESGESRPLRVLCLGDSHTYGIWVEPEDAYPARLRRKLARWPEPVEVLNAGVPGMNSSQVRRAVPEMLLRFQPDIVLLMVGVADFWNLDAFRAEEYSGWRWWLQGWWWNRSRVVKLVRLLRFNLGRGKAERAASVPVVEHTPYNWRVHAGDAAIDVDIDMHFDDGLKDILVFRRNLRRNLATIATEAEGAGARLVLMTYPTDSPFYHAVNQVYRQFAAEENLPLIDLGAALSRWAAPRLAEKAYFPDFHPRRIGYEESARVIAARLHEMVHERAQDPAP